MKKTLFLLLLPFALFSQTDTTSAPIDTTPVVVNPPQPPTGLTKDTIYSKVVDGFFYIVNRKVSDNGSYTETAQFVGDTTALIDRAEGIIVQNSDVLYKAAILVLTSQRYWVQAISDDAALYQAYGQSPLLDIQQGLDAQFLNAQWAIQSAAGVAPVLFQRNQIGKLTVTIGEAEKIVHLVGQCMRIEDFTPAGAMNFYRVAANAWVNAERTHSLITAQ